MSSACFSQGRKSQASDLPGFQIARAVLTVRLVGQDPWDSFVFSGAPQLSLDSEGLILRDSLVFTLACLYQALLQNHAFSICADNTVFFGIADERKPESEFISLPQALCEWQSAFTLHCCQLSATCKRPHFPLHPGPKQAPSSGADDNSSGLRAYVSNLSVIMTLLNIN